MKSTVLSVYDEGAMVDTSYIGAKGFSVLVDVDGERTLFDTGMRGRYLMHNLDYLEIPPDSITRVVLSHNHRANIGGLGRLLDNRTEPLDVYVNPSYSSMKGRFGRPVLTEEQASKAVFHEIGSNMSLSRHLTAIGPFGDEQEICLVLSAIKGPVVIASCYHAGTRCVFEEVRSVFGRDPYNLIGGMHIPKANQKKVDPTADVIREYGSPFMYLGHCAGEGAITYLRVRFNLKGVDDFIVGTSIDYEVTV